MREDRSIPCPAAVTKIRQALADGSNVTRPGVPIESVRKFAEFAGIDEATLRKLLKKERATLRTLQTIAEALGIPTKALLS